MSSAVSRLRFQADDRGPRVLTSALLEHEQRYQLTLAQRHRVTQHTPGVVQGLELVADVTGIAVGRGYAVDGFGRELALEAPVLLGDQLRLARQVRPDAPAFRVVLQYGRVPDKDRSFWDETPTLTVVPSTDALVRATFVPEAQAPPDDADQPWPVSLGLLAIDDQVPGGWRADMSSKVRDEVGLRARAVTAPDGAPELRLGKEQVKLFLPSPGPSDPFSTASKPAPRLTIGTDGATLAGTITVAGELEVAGVLTLARVVAVADPWTLTLRPPDGRQLTPAEQEGTPPADATFQILLPPEGVLTVGQLSDGKTTPILTLAAGLVTVHGDLVVEGEVKQTPDNAWITAGLGPSVPQVTAPPLSGGASMATYQNRVFGESLRDGIKEGRNPLRWTFDELCLVRDQTVYWTRTLAMFVIVLKLLDSYAPGIARNIMPNALQAACSYLGTKEKVCALPQGEALGNANGGAAVGAGGNPGPGGAAPGGGGAAPAGGGVGNPEIGAPSAGAAGGNPGTAGGQGAGAGNPSAPGATGTGG